MFYREGWLVIIVIIILGLPLKPPHHATRLITGSVWLSRNWLPVAKICGGANGSCLQVWPIHRICTSKPNTRGYVWGSCIDRAKRPPTSVIRVTIWIKRIQPPDFKNRCIMVSSSPVFLNQIIVIITYLAIISADMKSEEIRRTNMLTWQIWTLWKIVNEHRKAATKCSCAERLMRAKNMYRNCNSVMHELFLECASTISRCNYRHLREHLDTVRPVLYQYTKQNQATVSGRSFLFSRYSF